MEIKEKIKDFFEDNFMIPLDEISSDASLLENGILDSTGVLELVLFIETEYNITIAEDEVVPENLDSLNSIDRFIQSKTNGKKEHNYVN